jgi:CubicO group peptidase (beta-lactamase class C family)
MSRTTLLSGLIVALLFVVSCNPTPQPSSNLACDPNGCISLSAFSLNIALALQGQVDGYVIHVGGVAPVSWGQARTSADQPAMPMSQSLPTQIASVTKLLTAVGVIQSLARHNLSIDDKISPYLWLNWQQGPGIQNITFHELMTHKAGFVNWQACNGSNTTYYVLQNLISNGITTTLPGPPVYNNCDFAIFREMLPFMEGQGAECWQTNIFGQRTWSGLQCGFQNIWSANFYIDYMNQHVFGPLGLGSRQCKPAEPNVTLSYPFPAGSSNGDDWQDWTLSCGGGGWVLSADDLFIVANDLANGGILLSSEQKTNMNTDCLGWDCFNGGQFDYVAKNGGLTNGKISLETLVGIYKCNVPVVVVVNSPTPGGINITSLVANAYYSAKTNDPAQECPGFRREYLRVRPTEQASHLLPPPPQVFLPPPRPERGTTPTPSSARGGQPPVPLAPIAAAAVPCERVSLTWRPGEEPGGIRDYGVELEKLVDKTFVSERTWDRVQGESVPFDPTCDTHYRWRVRATNGAGNQGDWSRYGFFRVKEAAGAPPAQQPTPTPTPRDVRGPRPPVQIAPVDGTVIACGQAALSWNPAEDPSGIRDYDVQLEKLADRTFVEEKTWNNVRDETVAFDPTCDQHYRWRVRATDNAGNAGAWSDYQDFDVQSQIQ